VECDQFAERGRGEVFDVAEVQQDLAAAVLIDELEQVFTDLLNVLLVEDLSIDEVHDGHVADLLGFEAAPTGLRRHGRSSFVECQPPASHLPRRDQKYIGGQPKDDVNVRATTSEVKHFFISCS